MPICSDDMMNRDSDPHSPMSAPTRHCVSCGYNLRGTTSSVCPECGAPKLWQRISILDATDFSAACALLARENIAHRRVEALPQLPTVSGSRFIASEIWIAPNDADRVLRLLDDADIPAPMPVVDRSEASCPQCNGALDAKDAAVCPQCGLTFQWIEIEDDESRDGPADDRAPRPSQPGEQWTTQRWDVIIPIVLGLIMVLAGLAVTVVRAPGVNSTIVQSGGWIGVCLMLIGIIVVRAGFVRRRHQRPSTTDAFTTEEITAEGDIDPQDVASISRPTRSRRLQRLAPWVAASVLAVVATPLVMMVLEPIGSLGLFLLAPLIAFVLLATLFQLVRGSDDAHRSPSERAPSHLDDDNQGD